MVARQAATIPSIDRYCAGQVDEIIRTDVTSIFWPLVDEAIEPPLAAVVPLEVVPAAPAPLVEPPAPLVEPGAPVVEVAPEVDDPLDASVPVTSI